MIDLGRNSSLPQEFSQWKFTRSLLPHPHFYSLPPHTGLTPDDPSSWSPGERVEECVSGERSHGEWFAWQLRPFPWKSNQKETQALHRVRCSFPRKSWTPHRAAGTEKLPGTAGNYDSHQPCHWLLPEHHCWPAQGCDSLCDGWNQTHAGTADASKKHQPRISCPDRVLC